MRDLFKKFARSKPTLTISECNALMEELRECCEQNKKASREIRDMEPIKLDNCISDDIKDKSKDTQILH